MKSKHVGQKSYLNEFTCEWWRGNEDRHLAPDYVTRISFAFTSGQTVYTGRIDGVKTDDQGELRALREEILKAVFGKQK